jgi:uncharacterized membrane protein
MATNSGKPTVLGWDFHELQWRGGNEEMGSRKSDIEKLYCSSSWTETQILLQQYGIRYVILGNLERSTYQPNSSSCPNGLFEAKFFKFLVPAFSSANITIFEVPSWVINQ